MSQRPMARPKPSKVTKPASPSSSTVRMTRHRSKLASAGSSGGALQVMVDEVADSMDTANSSLSCDLMEGDADWYFENKGNEDTSYNGLVVESQESFVTTSQPRGKGKGRLLEVETEYRPFPIMELPTEIRLEIYRACLTRPKKIMLSKIEKPPQPEEPAVTGIQPAESDSNDSWEEERRDVLEMYQRSRASRGLPPSGISLPPRTTIRLRKWASRNSLSGRLSLPARSSSALASVSTLPTLPTSASQNTTAGVPSNSTNSIATIRWNTSKAKPLQDNRPKSEDPLVVNILRTSKQIYKEARDVLYSENIFDLDITTAVSSLAALHQRSRRHIKHVELEIPTYTEILERFSEVVRLSLRYCSGLKTFVIHTPFTLPGADGSMSASNTTVYANGFDILRWLPQECQVILEGNHNPEIDAVVNKHLNLAKTQDKDTYTRGMFMVLPDDQILNEDGKWDFVQKQKQCSRNVGYVSSDLLSG